MVADAGLPSVAETWRRARLALHRDNVAAGPAGKQPASSPDCPAACCCQQLAGLPALQLKVQGRLPAASSPAVPPPRIGTRCRQPAFGITSSTRPRPLCDGSLKEGPGSGGNAAPPASVGLVRADLDRGSHAAPAPYTLSGGLRPGGPGSYRQSATPTLRHVFHANYAGHEALVCAAKQTQADEAARIRQGPR